MKSSRFPLFLLLFSAAGCFADEITGQFGFEQPLKPGFVWKNSTGKVWFAPDPKVIQDFSGTKSHSGRGAFGLQGKVNLCMDAHGFLVPGKLYRLSVWVKPEKLYLPFSLNFIWFGKDGKVIQQNSVNRKLRDTAWQKISVTARAPKEFKNVYFLLHSEHSANTVYVDDLELTESTEPSSTERIQP